MSDILAEGRRLLDESLCSAIDGQEARLFRRWLFHNGRNLFTLAEAAVAKRRTDLDSGRTETTYREAIAADHAYTAALAPFVEEGNDGK